MNTSPIRTLLETFWTISVSTIILTTLVTSLPAHEVHVVDILLATVSLALPFSTLRTHVLTLALFARQLTVPLHVRPLREVGFNYTGLSTEMLTKTILIQT